MNSISAHISINWCPKKIFKAIVTKADDRKALELTIRVENLDEGAGEGEKK